MKSEIHDEILGLLKQDPSMPDYYRSTINFAPDEGVRVTLETQYLKDEDLPAVLERAHKSHTAIHTHKDTFHRAVSNQFLSEYNRDFSEGNPLSEEEFLSKIKLESVEFWQDGTFQLYYSPSGLEHFFGDHIIKIRINPDLQIDIIKLQ